MSLTLIRTMFEYNWWTHRRVWDVAMTVTDADYERDLGYSVGSIGAQLRHVVAVEYWWLHFLRTGAVQRLDTNAVIDRQILRTTWDAVEHDGRAWLTSLSVGDLDRRVHPAFWDEDEPAVTVAEALLQVANHGTDHRAQILVGLHHLGAETMGQDLLEFLHR